MAEFTHLFNAGKMNKDLDERLVPQGQYRDALNLDLANSENGNSGSLQNVEGNSQQRGIGINADECDGQLEWTDNYIDALSDSVCIGSIRNPKTECIYWFIASDEASIIAEYNQTTGAVSPIVVDKNNILLFSENYLITGINILDDFLFWTDNQTEPKKVNIKKFRIGSTNFTTHTKIPRYDQVTETYQTNLAGQPDFLLEDITVIKKSPLTAPTLNMGSSKFGSDIPGTGVNYLRTKYQVTDLENFTYIPDVTNDPEEYISMPTYGEYIMATANDPNVYANSSLPSNWNGEITFDLLSPPSYGIVNGNPVWQDGDILALRATFTGTYNNNYEYQGRFLIVPNGVNGDSITVQIQSISTDILKFYDQGENLLDLIWEVVLEEETPIFEYVFPRFAYRWKYIDNEYSVYSPFTQVAFLPNKFKYLSSDGYNVGMTNNIRKLIIENLTWGSEEVVELDILYKQSNSNAVYVVDTIKRNDYTAPPFSNQLITEFEIKNELIGSIVESNQLLRPWDNVPLRAQAQEIIGNRIVYGNYFQNYTVGTVSLTTNITVAEHPSKSAEFEDPDNPGQYTENIFSGDAEASLKSIRTYQVGVVYRDQFGRETPVFSSQNATVYVDISNACKIVNLQAKLETPPPGYATHYKYFVKETSTPYYNLALDRFYGAEDGNIWLSFPSSERNKLDEETYLILKKQHDNSNPVEDLNKYKVLAIENEAPPFIAQFEETAFFGTVNLENEVGPGFITFRFTGPAPDKQPNLTNSVNSANKIRLSKGGFETDEYGIEKGGIVTGSGNSDEVSFQVKLKKPFAEDAAWLEGLAAGDDVELTVFTPETKNLAEFEGRFFAKINRDFAFNENIIQPFAALEKNYVVLDEVQPQVGLASGGNPRGYFWRDAGWSRSAGPFGACSEQTGEYKTPGAGGWGGNGTAFTPDFRVRYNPPTRGRVWIGFTFIGQRSGPIDDFVGTAQSDGEFSPSGAYCDAGSYIRFVATVNSAIPGNSYDVVSGVYQIEEAFARGTLRGARNYSWGGCEVHDGAGNKKYSMIIKLDKPLGYYPQDSLVFPQASTGSYTPVAELNTRNIRMQIVTDVYDGDNKLLTSQNPAVFETEPKESADLDLYYEASNALPISQHGQGFDQINWSNCFSFGNGAESNRIRDDFNENTIDKGPRVSTVLDEPYALEHRGSGFIYSQIYNSTSGINRLNQFIQAEKITKDLNPVHGTIQKLHARDTDLIALCEDKCFRVLANKDALFNADGNAQLTGNNAVLGQTVPYAGDYGISKNPESFSSYAFRTYFTDKNRGAVIRLSRDGITVISENGMSDFFSDNLATSTKVIGTYDEDKGLYNVTLNSLTPYWQSQLSTDKDYNLTAECPVPDSVEPSNLIQETTVSFDERLNGWTSRKSFIPESGISLNNTYYTFKDGLMWEHGLNPTYNNFYNRQYFSTVNLLINDSPQSVKGYTALNYSGTQSRELEYQYNSNWYSIAEINAKSFTPTAVQIKKEGWYSNFIRTNLESGEIKEFENKEGKYFNYIKVLEVCKKGAGIGSGNVDPVSQDYFLTSGLSCIGRGIDCDDDGTPVPVPDTLLNTWYRWASQKVCSNINSASINILGSSSAQDAKCTIDDFYECLQGVYNQHTISGQNFMFIFADGIGVGTQLYSPTTQLPITSSGYYLIGTTNEQLVQPCNSCLDENNSDPVPNSYYLMKLTNGIITEYTQYNTLTANCSQQTNKPDLSLRLNAGYYNNVQSYSLVGASTINSAICGMKNALDVFLSSTLPQCDSDNPPPNCKYVGWFSQNVHWFSSDASELGLGVVIYKYAPVSDSYLPLENNTYLYKATSGGNIGYSEEILSQWENPSTFSDSWYFIKTDSNGAITTFEKVNTYPACQ